MRKAIRVLKTPVTLLALLALLGYGAVWGYKHATADPTQTAAQCVMQDVGGTLTPERVTVRVLNGGTQGGHAKTTRFYLITAGFVVIYYNNSDREVPTTTIVGNSASDPEVQLLAKYFNGAVTEGDGRADHVVDVIVPTKFQEFAEPPKVSVPVNGPVCLPEITAGAKASSSASPSAGPSATPSSTPTKKK